jgi:prepilin-type N-terminal cleavage/methylation domain-containing protein
MPRQRRNGYTLLEMVAVLAVLVILGAIIAPSLAGFFGNTKQKAAADIFRTRLAEARAKAMERGTPYRVAVHSDQTRIRVGPDTENFGTGTAEDPPSYGSVVTEDTLDEATIELQLEEGDERPSDGSEWSTVATLRPDGSSKEARSCTVTIKQSTFAPIVIQVRGLTGQARNVPQTPGGQQ